MDESMTDQKGGSLIDHFGTASLIIVLGVCASWLVLKQTGTQNLVSVPQIPEFAWSVSTNNTLAEADASLVDRAEAAFAAGNISLPMGDSALFYYQEALAANAEDEAAKDGLQRTVKYLMGSAEGAVFRNDWTAADSIAEQVLATGMADDDATSLQNRVSRYKKIERLTTQAASYMAQGRLSVPTDRNAVDTYRKILALDANNTAAQQGIAMVAQRLLGSAQTSALAGDVAESEKIMERVAEFAPAAPGLKKTQALADQWDQMSTDRTLQADLLAAAKALREDRLVEPKESSALGLFRKVLKQDPKSEAAKGGLALVAQELVTRSWTQLRGLDLQGAAQALADAEVAGASPDSLNSLRKEIAHQNVLANARLGRVELMLPISQLEVVSQRPPSFPKRAAAASLDGWAEVTFVVSPTGDVLEPKVTKSSDKLFDRSALDAITEWRFKPHLSDDRAVPVRSGVRFTFRQ